MSEPLIANKSAPTSRHVDDQTASRIKAGLEDILAGRFVTVRGCEGTAAVLSAIAASNGKP